MYVLLQIFECFVYLHSSFYKAQYLGPDTYPTYLKGRLFECLRKHCPDHFDVLSHDQNWQLGCLWQLSIQSSRDGCRFCRWSKLFPKNTILSSKHELVPLPEILTWKIASLLLSMMKWFSLSELEKWFQNFPFSSKK